MLLTHGVSNTLSVLLVIDIWERNLCIWENWHVLHISHHFLTLNTWYLHLLVYYKYMFNFKWGLFCILGFGVTFFKFYISNLTWTTSSHDFFVLFQGCFGAHFWHFYKFFTCHCVLILCKSNIYYFLTHCMLIITIWM